MAVFTAGRDVVKIMHSLSKLEPILREGVALELMRMAHRVRLTAALLESFAAGVNEPLQHKHEYGEAVSQLPRSACADQRTENQAEIECADVNQLPLEDVLVSAQMSSPHSSGIVTMREAPLDQLASLAQQTLAVVPRYPLPVGVYGLLFILLSDPVPLARLLLF